MAVATKKSIHPLAKVIWEIPALKSIYIFFAALFFLNLLLRVFYLRYQFVNGDEAIRALTAAGWLDGARLYADIVTDKPPGTTFFYVAVFAVFGRSMVAVHLFATVWNFFTSIVVFKTASLIYGKRAGLLAALLFVYFSTNYFTPDMMAANTELLMALPYAASFYFYLLALLSQDKKHHFKQFAENQHEAEKLLPLPIQQSEDETTPARSFIYLFIAGLLTGLAILFKQPGVFNAFFFCLSEAMFIYRDRKKTPLRQLFLPSLKRLSLIAAGIAAVFAALIFWLYKTSTLADFWRYVFVINRFYVESLPMDLRLKFMFSRILGYIVFNLFLWTLAIWTIWQAIKSPLRAKTHTNQEGSRPSNSPDASNGLQNDWSRNTAQNDNVFDGGLVKSVKANRCEWLLIVWAFVSLAAVFAGGRFFGHYFFQILPALAILAAQSLAQLLEQFSQPTYKRKAVILAVVLLVFFMVGFVRIHHRTAILAYEAWTGKRTNFSAEWGMSQREHEAEMISKSLGEILSKNESLYIWDYALDIYWRTGCRPASRFLTPNHLTGAYTGEEAPEELGQNDFWKQNRQFFIEDLQRNRPRIIVDPTGGLEYAPYAEIVEFVKENYRRDKELGIYPARPFVVYKRKED